MTRSHQESQPTKRLPARKSKKLQITTVINCTNDQKFLVLKEKNRQSAQRSRDNKKRYVMNLESKISELQLENEYLRNQLSLCHCSRQEQPDNTAAASQDDPKIAEESPESSFFERVSVKSFASCSNFLILSLVMMFCVFGLVDVTGDADKPHNQLYSHQSVMTAIARYSIPDGSCDGGQVPVPPKLHRPDGRPAIQVGNTTLGQPDIIDRPRAPQLDTSRLALNASRLVRSK